MDEQNKDPQEMDIPVLQQKKKEKKGGGFLLPGGAGAAARSAGGGLAAMLTGKAGMAVIALCVGGAGLIGYGVVQQNRSRSAGRDAPSLGAPEMGVRANRRNANGSRSLAYMAKAGQGEIRWDEPNNPAAANAKKDAAAPEKGEGVAEQDADAMAKEMMGKLPNAPDQTGLQRGRGGLSSAKLSSQLGGSFGKHNIFSGGSGFSMKNPKKLDKADLGGLAKFRGKVQNPRSSNALGRAKTLASAKHMSTRRIGANKAMGQLKFANKRSHEAADSGTSETGSSYAAQAFDQNEGEAGTIGGGIEGGGADTVDPIGGGAPDATDDSGGGGGDYSTPGTGDGTNVTPYQDSMDSSESMTTIALVMAVLGIALIAIGAYVGGWWGAIIAVIGAIILGVGIAMAMMAQSTGSGAASSYGQDDQAGVIEDHTNAAAQGRESDSTVDQSDKQNHVDGEQMDNATYEEK